MALTTAALPLRAQEAPAATLPLPLARQVAGRTIELVEAHAVYPRRQADYDAAKARVLATLDEGGDDIDRSALFLRLAALLATLDADGHSFIMPARGQQPTAGQLQPRATDGVHLPTLKMIDTGHGTVLRWTPPAILDSGPAASAAWLQRLSDEAAGSNINGACALVIDLSEQTGGTAWPPLIAMRALFSAANTAVIVDRAGKRKPVFDHAYLDYQARRQAPGAADPLAAFAGMPLAVVVGSHTSSAGEMELVALLGEARVQTFGRPSGGLSTANMTYALPDGSFLVLTEQRYAQADGPIYHGRIDPMHLAAADETIDATVRKAADWAAANSSRCKAQAGAAPD